MAMISLTSVISPLIAHATNNNTLGCFLLLAHVTDNVSTLWLSFVNEAVLFLEGRWHVMFFYLNIFWYHYIISFYFIYYIYTVWLWFTVKLWFKASRQHSVLPPPCWNGYKQCIASKPEKGILVSSDHLNIFFPPACRLVTFLHIADP